MINDMLSDRIEQFILEQLARQAEDALILKRKDVAERLDCAPSQVTYVVNTRFSPDRRYTVESRRGSGGFIRISVRHIPPTAQPAEETGPGAELTRFYHFLVSSGAITMRELLLIRGLIDLFLSHCPEDKKEIAAKEAMERVTGIIRNGK